jgi:drug/metabolite transporter (DMT)-like permease
VASPIFFATFNNGLRLVSADIGVYGLLFLRGVVGVTLAIAVTYLTKTIPIVKKLGLLALTGLSGALASAATTTSITMIPLYQAVVILYLYPAMTVIMARILVGERITIRALARVITAFVGCVLLVLPGGDGGLSLSLGHAIGLLGAALYALSYVLTRRLGQDHRGLEPFIFYCLACMIVAFPLASVFSSGFGIDNLKELTLGLTLGSLGAGAQLMAFAALKHIPAHTVGVIGTLEILCGTLSSWLLFSDPFTPIAVLGAAIVIYAAFGFRERRLPLEVTP